MFCDRPSPSELNVDWLVSKRLCLGACREIRDLCGWEPLVALGRLYAPLEQSRAIWRGEAGLLSARATPEVDVDKWEDEQRLNSARCWDVESRFPTA